MKLTKAELLQKLNEISLVAYVRSGNAYDMAQDMQQQGQDYLEGYYTGLKGAYEVVFDMVERFLKEEK